MFRCFYCLKVLRTKNCQKNKEQKNKEQKNKEQKNKEQKNRQRQKKLAKGERNLPKAKELSIQF